MAISLGCVMVVSSLSTKLAGGGVRAFFQKRKGQPETSLESRYHFNYIKAFRAKKTMVPMGTKRVSNPIILSTP